MKFLIKIITKIIKNEPPKPLGRWNIEYCKKKINNKIDLSNEDHCGPCGQYALSKVEVNGNKTHSNTEINYKKPNENIV